MAAVTQSEITYPVFGNKRAIAARVQIAATGDTFNTTLSKIQSWSAISNTNDATAIGGTVSGGTITFVTGGAEVDVYVLAIGY